MRFEVGPASVARIAGGTFTSGCLNKRLALRDGEHSRKKHSVPSTTKARAATPAPNPRRADSKRLRTEESRQRLGEAANICRFSIVGLGYLIDLTRAGIGHSVVLRCPCVPVSRCRCVPGVQVSPWAWHARLIPWPNSIEPSKHQQDLLNRPWLTARTARKISTYLVSPRRSSAHILPLAECSWRP
jgi:hypothetical protein